ncbi:MAG: Global nitrogen regulator [Syntrophomonadaceae bacterium]|nr:Global nitrogen regulator [Bacillota bacterium]
MNSMIQLLNKCSLFNHLSVEETEKLLMDITFSFKYYKRKEVIFSPLHPADTLGILLAGSIDAQKIFASGKVITISRRFPYDLIADVPMFANTSCYPSIISACENSHIWLVNKANLLKIFTKDPRVMLKFLESVSNRALALNSVVELLSLNSVPAKIAYFLTMEQKKQRSSTISLKFPKKSLAEQINVSRPALSRELKKMQSEGIISCHKRTIRIHSTEKLADLCSH